MINPVATRSASSTPTTIPAPAAWIKRRLTETEAAEVLNLSTRTLQQWRVKGGGPPFKKYGASVRYDPDALAAWDRDQTRTNTSGPAPLPANHIPTKDRG